MSFDAAPALGKKTDAAPAPAPGKKNYAATAPRKKYDAAIALAATTFL
jgi:hypothetical protein